MKTDNETEGPGEAKFWAKALSTILASVDSIVFVDQNGQKRNVKNVRIESDKRKSKVPIKLQREAAYKLEHEVEKKVAAVLKDEITRYKKFGRRHHGGTCSYAASRASRCSNTISGIV